VDAAFPDAQLLPVERLAAVLLALATAHPGHDDGPVPPGVTIQDSEVNTPAARLAASLLDRGQPGLAARLVARDAPSSADAARVLAQALDALDDPVGARIARERADRLDREVAPPSARAALPAGAGPGPASAAGGDDAEEPGQRVSGDDGIRGPR
jgi:hypothetical protein